jgi:hypothetical protein
VGLDGVVVVAEGAGEQEVGVWVGVAVARLDDELAGAVGAPLE